MGDGRFCAGKIVNTHFHILTIVPPLLYNPPFVPPNSLSTFSDSFTSLSKLAGIPSFILLGELHWISYHI